MAVQSITGDAGPDREAAIAQYRRRAQVYDLELAAFEPVRRQTVARLALSPGDTVLDLGCGTGLSLDLLVSAVGPHGRVFGLEQCEAMLDLARDRVVRHGWRNVTLVGASVQSADLRGAGLDRPADAAIFHFTHDILQSPTALAHVARHLRAGATVAAAGLQWAPWWCWPVNFFVWPAALHSVSSLQGLDRPWRLLADWTTGLEVEPILGGGGFLAGGFRSAREA